MGLMLEGRYLADDPAPDTDAHGRFQRQRSTMRNQIGEERFPADARRYHVYVAWNCPWAHRVLLVSALLGLENDLGFSYARPRRTDQGWVYDADGPFSDPLLGVSALHEIYTRGAASYSGKVTVPILWDKPSGSIVSNESADILRMLDREFGDERFYPAALRDKIDAWNDLIYPGLNNGVYRAGFARTQAAYDEAVREVFATLDRVETQLAETRYLAGDQLTDADIRLFPTLARFDVAYHSAFNCNLRRIVDYANLWAYAREIHQMPGIAETVAFDVYRRGYHSPSPERNPLGIVPIGPENDWTAPHRRG